MKKTRKWTGSRTRGVGWKYPLTPYVREKPGVKTVVPPKPFTENSDFELYFVASWNLGPMDTSSYNHKLLDGVVTKDEIWSSLLQLHGPELPS